MYAVVKTGGKQYRVTVGDKLKVETLNAGEGDKVTLDQVLMIGDGDKVEIGTPFLDSAVEATVLGNGRGKKLRIVKFRRRQNSRTRTGHRQNFTELEITKIGTKAPAKPAQQAAAASTDSKAKKAKKAKKESKTKDASKTKKVSETGSKADSKVNTKAARDDLTRISGVGPVIVGKLEAMGITTFQQIADFTDEDIVRVDEELNFKGRIERDEWVKQAQKFLQQES